MTTTAALLALFIGLACGDKDADTAQPGDGGSADGGGSDGGSGDGGSGDGGAGDGGTGDGGSDGGADGGSEEFDGSCLMCHADEDMLKASLPEDTGDGAHEEPSGEG